MANDLDGGGGNAPDRSRGNAPDIGPVQSVVDTFLAEVRTVELTLKESVVQLTVENVILHGRILLLELDLAFKSQALQNAETRIGQLQAQLASKTCQCNNDPVDVRAQHNQPVAVGNGKGFQSKSTK